MLQKIKNIKNIKQIPKSILGLSLTVIILITSVGITSNDMFRIHSVKQQKGKYYNQEIPQKPKVKEVEPIVVNPTTPIRKPFVPVRNPMIEKQVAWNHQKSVGQEEIENRTYNSKTYYLGDGKYKTIVFLGKIHFKNSKGQWQDIDNTLVAANKFGEKAYTNKANDFKSYLPEHISGKTPISIEESQSSIQFIPQFGSFTNIKVLDNAVRYNNVLDGTDFQYTVLNDRMKEEIILNRKSTNNEFVFQVDYDDITLKQEGNLIFAYDKKTKEKVWAISAPYMQDANGSISYDVKLTLKKHLFSKDEIIVTADKKWLDEKKRAYPVVIDPSTTYVRDTNIGDTAVESNFPDIITDNDFSYIGYDNGSEETTNNIERYGKALGKNRLYMTFDLPSQLLKDKRITSSALNLYKYTDYSDSLREVELHQVNQSFDIHKLTWNNQPTETSYQTSRMVGANKGYYTWDIKALVGQWLAGTPNHGIMLKSHNESAQCEVYRSNNYSDANQRPYLAVEYEEQGDVDPGMDLTAPTTKLRPFVAANNNGVLNFVAVSTDGISKPRSIVQYQMFEGSQVVFANQTEANLNYLYPNVIINFPGVNTYSIKESNWQISGPILYTQDNKGLKLNTLYQFKTKAVDVDGKESPIGSSDTFQLYQVKSIDLLPRILQFYGIKDKASFMRDNNMKDELLVENNVIFIRNPKSNQGKPYTPAQLTDKEKRKIDSLLMGRGKHCEFGFEPINLNTGNFYFNAEDVNIPELGKNFTIERSYNSTAPAAHSPLGQRWDYNWDKYISYLEDGNIAFNRGDGSVVYFEKNADGSYSAPVGERYIVKKLQNQFEIYEVDTETTYRFKPSGLIEFEKDLYGNQTAFTYDEYENLTAMTTASGKKISVEVDEQGRIKKLTLPNQNTLSYEYDEQGNLIRYTDPKGAKTEYQYDDDGRMISYTDPNGHRVIHNVYDDKNRIVEQTDANGKTAYLKYFDGYTETVDNNGNHTKYYFDSQYRTTKIVRPDGKTEEKTYTSNNQLHSVKDVQGRLMTFEYDAKGNKTKEIRWDGKAAVYTYNDNNRIISTTDFNGKVTKMEYDSRGNLTRILRPDQSTTEYKYNDKAQLIEAKDAEDRVSKYEYDGAQVSKVTDPKGNAFQYYYDEMGHIVTIIDPLNRETRFSYSKNGELYQIVLPDGSITEHMYDADGNNTVIVDGKGYATYFTYDAMNRMTQIKDPLSQVTTMKYDGNGNKIEEKDPRGYTTSYVYDSLNQLVKEIDPEGGVTVYERDAFGNEISVTDPMGNQTKQIYNYDIDEVEKTISPTGQTIQYQYDDMGNLLKMILPDGTVKEYRYDDAYRLVELKDDDGVKTFTTYNKNGLITKIEDSLGNVYLYQYDANGNLIQTTDPMGYVVKYAYDAANQMTEVIDEEGGKTTYRYNETHKLQQITDPLGSTVSYKYDKNGNLASETDALGHTKNYVYDPLDRLQAEKDALENIVQYQYDAVGNMTKQIDALGQATVFKYNGTDLMTETVDALGHRIQMKYDKNGNEIAVVDPTGKEDTFTYDAEGQLTSTTDTSGVKKEFVYDVMGQVTKESDNIGNTMTYQYDSFGNLIEEKDTLGRIKKYAYDGAGRLISETDIDGNTTRYQYDKRDRVVKVIDPEEKVTSLYYDGLDQLVKKVEPQNRIFQYQYDLVGNLLGITDPLQKETKYVYDKSGRLIKETNAKGNSKQFEYDAADRLVTALDERNNKTTLVYDANDNLIKTKDPMGNTTQYVYDALNRIDKEIDALGFDKEYQYDSLDNITAVIDAKGNKTRYQYNTQGLLTKQTDALGGVSEYQYDLNGNLLMKKDEKGAQYRYTYDAVHRLKSVTDPLNYAVTYDYDEYGNLKEEKDSTGRATRYAYDKMHRLLSETNTVGNITSYQYDTVGNLSTVKAPNGNTAKFQYDVLDRITQMMDPEGKVTGYQYDPLGNVEKVSYPGQQEYRYTYDAANNIKEEINPLGQKTNYTYNKNNLLETVTNPIGSTIQYTYDAVNQLIRERNPLGFDNNYQYDGNGNVTSIKDANNNLTQYQYDALNQVKKVTNPLGDVTQYGYDEVGNMTSMQDANGHETRYQYDLRSQLTQITNPLGQKEQYEYDAVGNLSRYTKKDGTKISYTYDKLDRMTGKKYNTDGTQGLSASIKKQNIDAAAPLTEVSYQYDIMDNRVSMEGAEGETKYTYDDLGRLTTVTFPTGEKVKYEYDSLGRKSKVLYPDGHYVTYKYDQLNRMTQVVDDRGDQTQYKYDAAGRRTEVLYPNGTKAMYTYDKADQVVGLKNIDKNGKVLSSFKYVYDASGQMIEETQTQQEEIYQRSYQYNKANEIIGFTEEHQGQITKYEYHYDGVGNRTGLTITGPDGTRNIQYTYNSTNQLITETEGDKVVHYEYDHNGNLIRKKGPGNQVEYYAYDEENRLVQIVEHQGKGQTFGYDSDGNRLFRTVSRNNGNGNGNGTPNHGVGNGKGQGYDNGKGHDKQEEKDKELNKPESYEYIRYINDISVPYPQVLMTADSKGTYRGVYTYGLERISVRDEVSVEGKPNNPLYYLYDGRGSVSQLTNTIGNVRDEYRYEPFGAPMPEGELEPDTRLLNNPYGYNGEDYDIESDLQYLRARYYDPEIGRFISEDSYLGEIMQPLTLNRYAYTENNPLMYQDPSGHWSIRGLWNGVKSAVKHVYKKYVAPVYKRYVAPVYKRYIAPKVNRIKRYVKHRVRKYVRKARRAYRRAKRWAERKIAAHKKKSRSKHVTRSKKQNQKPKSKQKNYAKQKASQVKNYNKSGCDGKAKIGSGDLSLHYNFDQKAGFILGLDSGLGGIITASVNLVRMFNREPLITEEEIDYHMKNTPGFADNYYAGQVVSLLGSLRGGISGKGPQPSLAYSSAGGTAGATKSIIAFNPSIVFAKQQSQEGNREKEARNTSKGTAEGSTGEYGDVGGHHIHAKAGFKGDINYDPNKGFSISQAFMKNNGWNHSDMTTKQRQLFKELYESGRPNTLQEHTRIAKEALKAGGATEVEADKLISKSLENLKEQGVTQPTRIPWYSK